MEDFSNQAIALDDDEIALVSQACRAIEAISRPGYTLLSAEVGDAVQLAIEPTEGQGRADGMQLRYQSAGGSITLTSEDSQAIYIVSKSSIARSKFSRESKRSTVEETIALAYGLGEFLSSEQVIVPDEPVAIGSRWQYATTNEHGGVLTLYQLKSFVGNKARIGFQRFVCLRNVPYASPDGELDPVCQVDEEEMRVEQGTFTLAPNLPLPNSEASRLGRITRRFSVAGCGEDIVLDLREQRSLEWIED